MVIGYEGRILRGGLLLCMGKIFNMIHQKDFRQMLRRRMTWAELKLWSYLKGKQFRGLKFRRQQGIGPYVTDFYCPEKRLVLEIDGDSHFEDGADVYDHDREIFFIGLGLRVLRFTNQEIYQDLDGVLERIRQALLDPL